MSSEAESEEERYASIELDPDGYFEGLSKQSMKFHNALAELIDNSISANINDEDYFDLDNPEQRFRIQISITRFQDRVEVIVADAGEGMSMEVLESNILQQGNREEAEGILNEHGMGLKNSLAVLTRNQGEEPFKILSACPTDSELDRGEYVRVRGPFSQDMRIEKDDNSEEWADGSGALEDLEQGTRVHLTTDHEMVRSSWRSATHLQSVVPGLREHLGVMYRKYFEHSDNNHIHLQWEDKVQYLTKLVG